MRRGVAELDGEGEVVGGIVVMRSGENALDVIDAVKARLAEIAPTLPEGVEIVTTYDRSELIRGAIATLRRALIEEMAIVSFVIFVFLLHARSALIPILTIPVGVLLAFIPMLHQGLTANIMSLGGIAVAIGAMVDASIILVENIHKRLEEWEHAGPARAARATCSLRAMQEVGPSVFFALLVITVSFLPIFALEAHRGAALPAARLHEDLRDGLRGAALGDADAGARGARDPRAHPQRGREPGEPLAWCGSTRRWCAGWCGARPSSSSAALLGIVVTMPVALSLGSEFMPPLNEGTILYMPTAPPGHVDRPRRSACCSSMDRELPRVPRGRARVRQDRPRRLARPTRRRSRWSRRSSS